MRRWRQTLLSLSWVCTPSAGHAHSECHCRPCTTTYSRICPPLPILLVCWHSVQGTDLLMASIVNQLLAVRGSDPLQVRMWATTAAPTSAPTTYTRSTATCDSLTPLSAVCSLPQSSRVIDRQGHTGVMYPVVELIHTVKGQFVCVVLDVTRMAGSI